VGNPFLEKLLIEACLELAGDPDIVAMQDLGAAGLTGAATEMAAHGGCGIDVDVALVPRREDGMTSFEIMLSESQERMLLVVLPGAEERVRQGFERWDLHCATIGRVTDDGLVRIRDRGTVIAELPAAFLSGGAPEYSGARAGGQETADRRHETPNGAAPFPQSQDLSATLLELIGSPNLCSRRPVFEQYDHMVQTNTVVGPGEGAAVLRLKGWPSGLALGVGGNGRVAAADPWIGGAGAVAEACRNVACAGAVPVALTDCLNFGDPEDPAAWSDLAGVIEGMRAACLALDVPIISGNVSLYNLTDGEAVVPTAIVGALGLLERVDRHAAAAFKPGQAVWLVGPLAASLWQSAYASLRGRTAGKAATLDLQLERRVQECVRDLVAGGVVETATDIADGGLAVALAELALASGIGVRCDEPWVRELEAGDLGRAAVILFGEAPSRIIIAAPPDREHQIQLAAERHSVPLTRLGQTGSASIDIGAALSVALDDAFSVWSTGLNRVGGA
jgi:phosphoribosylformylglycinamidine synthase